MTLFNRYKRAKSTLDDEVWKRNSLLKRKEKLLEEVVELRKDIRATEKAQVILQEVAQKTQQELEFQISEICSLAMKAVFPDPYEVKVDFVIRRGKTECDIYFERDGERYKPLDSCGGGAVDVASFALRVAMWCISGRKLRPLIILDEPFKHLSSNLQPRASEMLKELSDKLGLQMIVVSHNDSIVESADNVIDMGLL